MKSLPNQAGLYRTFSAYHFRKRIPKDIQPILKVRECKKSFKKTDYQAAKHAAAFLNTALELLFATIRAMQPTSNDINFLIRNYFEKLLMNAEYRLYWDTEVWQGLVTDDHDGATPDQRLETLEAELQDMRNLAKRQGHQEYFHDTARQLLQWKGFTFSQMSPTSIQLFRGLLDAELEAKRIELAARNGNTGEIEIRHPLLKDCRNFMVNPDIDLMELYGDLPYYAPISEGLSLKETVDKFIEFSRHKDYAGNGLQEIETALGHCAEIIGPTKRIQAVTNEDIRNLRNAILEMPSNYTKIFRPKGLSVTDVINQGGDYKRLSGRSQDKYWQWVKMLFNWCVDEGYLNVSPVKKIKVAPVKHKRSDRDVFTAEELKAFFSSPIYSGQMSESRRTVPGTLIIRDGRFWIPLIGLFQGMRATEIIQLLPEDIRYDGSTPYFCIHEDDEAHDLKTSHSHRGI